MIVQNYMTLFHIFNFIMVICAIVSSTMVLIKRLPSELTIVWKVSVTFPNGHHRHSQGSGYCCAGDLYCKYSAGQAKHQDCLM